MGEVNLFLQFLDIFFKYFTKNQFENGKFNDQAFLQWELNNHVYENHKIPYAIDGSNGTAACILFQKIFKKDHYLEFGYSILSDEVDEYAMIVHQYDRFPTMRKRIYNACPQNNLNVPDFIRTRRNSSE